MDFDTFLAGMLPIK